ncbi:MAG: GTPase domain-containing protein [Ktedonobacterales bacterium]
MALINVANREIQCKIVYYGTGFCGKTTNLQYIYRHAPQQARGDLLSIATESERTLFFDFLPLDLGSVHGFRVRFALYTVPGQVLYERTRVAVLNGVDGLVFVADSAPEKLEENFQNLIELETNVKRMSKDLGAFPFVMQWNKRDLPNAVPVETLERYLNRRHAPTFQASALTGVGVFPTLRAICKGVMANL